MSGNFTRVSLPVGNDSGATDWQRIQSLTDGQIDTAIADDADAYALTTTQLGHQAGRYRYELFPDANGAWRWRLVNKDGQIMAEAATSFASRKQATAAIAELRAALLGGALAA
jgi:uncharacterized protein YegP (UPF0339 family)